VPGISSLSEYRRYKPTFPQIEQPSVNHQRHQAAVYLPHQHDVRLNPRRTPVRFSDLFWPSGRPPPCRVARCRRRGGCPPGCRYQSNKTACGGARHSRSWVASAEAPFSSRWLRIFLITTRSSMQAMILTDPPQARQVSISIPAVSRSEERCPARVNIRIG
jgi:hypothetical protein